VFAFVRWHAIAAAGLVRAQEELRAMDSFETDLAAAYAAWIDSRGRRPDLFFDLYADDVELHSVLSVSLAAYIRGPFIGRREALNYFVAIAESWEMVEMRTEGIARGPDTVIWHGQSHWRNRKTLRAIAGPKVDIWTVRDGKAVRMLELYDTYGFAWATGLLDPPPVL
jgi:ketosteroid isomerase-like protein